MKYTSLPAGRATCEYYAPHSSIKAQICHDVGSVRVFMTRSLFEACRLYPIMGASLYCRLPFVNLFNHLYSTLSLVSHIFSTSSLVFLVSPSQLIANTIDKESLLGKTILSKYSETSFQHARNGESQTQSLQVRPFLYLSLIVFDTRFSDI